MGGGGVGPSAAKVSRGGLLGTPTYRLQHDPYDQFENTQMV